LLGLQCHMSSIDLTADTLQTPPPSPTLTHVYAALTPDLLLDAVESVGYRCDGRLLALNSYENRVYQVGLDDTPNQIIAKFYRPARWTDAQILEEHSFAALLSNAEIPVVAPIVTGDKTLHTFQGYRFALFVKRGGRAPELDRADVREWIGRFLGRIHLAASVAPFHTRPTLNIETFGQTPRQWLSLSRFIPEDIRPAWLSVADLALDGIAQSFARAGDVKLIRLHGDCHMGNILYTDDGPHFVDFDDCRMGPAVQDLWMLLSGTRDEMASQLRDVLDGYTEFHDFDYRELHIIEALRTLRMIHYSYWLASRADDPAFQLAFPWFFGLEAQRYWQNQVLALREQIALMNEPILALQLY